MEISGPSDVMAMQAAQTEASADVAMLKKSIDHEKDMASQLLETLPKVNHDAPPGEQVRMFA